VLIASVALLAGCSDDDPSAEPSSTPGQAEESSADRAQDSPSDSTSSSPAASSTQATPQSDAFACEAIDRDAVKAASGVRIDPPEPSGTPGAEEDCIVTFHAGETLMIQLKPEHGTLDEDAGQAWNIATPTWDEVTVAGEPALTASDNNQHAAAALVTHVGDRLLQILAYSTNASAAEQKKVDALVLAVAEQVAPAAG